MSDIVQRLRRWAESIRRNPSPLADAGPMVQQAADEIESLRAGQWIKVGDKMPHSGIPVLAYHKNRLGHGRRIRAMWVAAKTVESNCDSEIGEYDEEADCYYDPPGWYECMEHWPEYTAIMVVGEITHWMPLPAAPAGDAVKPAGRTSA